MRLTENRRILLNTMATYGRSLVSLCFGLFTARWVLLALGKNDLGLYGVVGSIIVFVVLLNNVMGNAVGRFYAYAIGESRRMAPADADDHLCRWFNAALTIHTVFPLVLIAIGYPVGVYAINHWLVIPPERLSACVWVFRLSLITAFANMVGVPYVSMYRARQLIVELSVWGMIQTVCVFCATYVVLSYSGDRLVFYALLMALIPVLVILIQSVRAYLKFPCCRIRVEYLFRRNYLLPIFRFGFWETFSCLGDICRQHGTAFIINRLFSSGVNAAYGIAMQVSAQTSSLSLALLGALGPALTTAEGAGDKERAMSLGLRSCKFSALLILLFAAPLILEMDYVLRLWLVTPPEYTGNICRCILCALVVHKLGWGCHMMLMAHGRIALLECVLGTTSLLTLPLIYVLVKSPLGVVGIGYSFIISYALLSLERGLFAKYLLGMSLWRWVRSCVLPVLTVFVLVGFACFFVQRTFEESFFRLVVVTLVCILMTCWASWIVVVDETERRVIVSGIKRITGKIRRARK